VPGIQPAGNVELKVRFSSAFLIFEPDLISDMRAAGTKKVAEDDPSTRDLSDHFFNLRSAFRERDEKQGVSREKEVAQLPTADDVYNQDELQEMAMHFQDFLKMTEMKIGVLQEQYKERLMFRMDEGKNEELDATIRKLTADIK
jgi:hypothetical protein